ncbi:hypothetical protein diail_9174 [Diaporthe ilicicola]|nr:hypothetical protein diail_9174 [Diaporthe ilicicola]
MANHAYAILLSYAVGSVSVMSARPIVRLPAPVPHTDRQTYVFGVKQYNAANSLAATQEQRLTRPIGPVERSPGWKDPNPWAKANLDPWPQRSRQKHLTRHNQVDCHAARLFGRIENGIHHALDCMPSRLGMHHPLLGRTRGRAGHPLTLPSTISSVAQSFRQTFKTFEGDITLPMSPAVEHVPSSKALPGAWAAPYDLTCRRVYNEHTITSAFQRGFRDGCFPAQLLPPRHHGIRLQCLKPFCNSFFREEGLKKGQKTFTLSAPAVSLASKTFTIHRAMRLPAHQCFHCDRIRKVKCDETKPYCLRCTKTGRKCDGYLDPRNLASRRRPRDPTPQDHVLGPLLDLSTPEEERAFYFFQHVTAPCISGDFDAVFWRTVVLQVAQTEPAVRHAVLSVSTLHEGLTQSTIVQSKDGCPTQSFALQQYNKAIARLLDQMNNPLTKPLASLLTCVLFVCIEFLQGKDKESLIHLEQGRQLLTRLDERYNGPEMECILRHVVPLYTRLSLTAFLFGGTPVALPDSLKSRGEIPDTFGSMDHLRYFMHEFMEQAFRFTHRARPAKNSSDSISRETMQMLEIEQDRLLCRLAKFNVAFSLFQASRSKPGPESTLLVLQMYLHAQYIWISTALSSSEVVYDNYLAQFAAIVPLAAAYIELEASQRNPSTIPTQRPSSTAGPTYPNSGLNQQTPGNHFTFETHIIPPLYYVATKCRHPLIRRSALNLLKRDPFRRENLWRASVMGALAGHVVSLEEKWAQRQSFSSISASHSPQYLSIRGTSLGHNTASERSMEQPSRIQSEFSSHDDPRRFTRTTEGTIAEAANNSVPRQVPDFGLFDFDADRRIERSADQSLHRDALVPSSLSQEPSLTSSTDGCSYNSVMDSAASGLRSRENEIAIWSHEQLQQPDHSGQESYQPDLRKDFAATASYLYHQNEKQMQLAGHAMGDAVSHSSSDESSPGADEQSYQTIPGSQGQQNNNYQSAMTNAFPMHQQQQHPTGSGLPSGLVTEAPFGLAEELRVHDAIIGREREEGSWVVVFRKLHGADADWDVQTDWVATG